MATDAVLFYEVRPTEYRGVRISSMGHAVADQLTKRFGADRSALVEFIEAGIGRAGYKYATDPKPRWDDADELPFGGYITTVTLAAAAEDYSWFLQADGTIAQGTLELITPAPQQPATVIFA